MKKFISFTLVVFSVFSMLFSFPIFANNYEGDWDNIHWMFDGETLEISGSGVIPHCEYIQDFSPAPWYGFQKSIKTIIIDDGITEIGVHNFRDCVCVSNVVFPSTLKRIHSFAFSRCLNLSDLELPASLKVIETNAFSDCISLEKIIVNGEIDISSAVFSGCDKLTELHLNTSGNVDVSVGFLGGSSINKLYLYGDAPKWTSSEARDEIGTKCDVSIYYEQDKNWTNDDLVNPFGQFEWIPFEKPFKDVSPKSWYYSYANWAFASGIMVGDSLSNFMPNKPLTRAEFATIFANYLNPNYKKDNIYDYGPALPTDLSSGSWYEKACLWCFAKGYIQGNGSYSNPVLFMPQKSCTREQFITILFTYAKGYDSMTNHDKLYNSTNDQLSYSIDLSRAYSDAENISQYAYDAMNWAVSIGLVSGTSESTLSPNGRVTRAQCATIMKSFDELYNG